MKKLLLLSCAFVVHQICLGQFTTPTVDGTISANEYGTHTNGINQQTNTLNWFMTWDNTYLYVAVSSYTNSNDALVFYIDHNPTTIVNGGSNTDGTFTGTNYDGLGTTAPFRADFFAYLKPGYDDYKYHDGAGGWGSSTTGSLLKSYSSTNNVFEVRIPWSAVTNGGARPASFNFVCFGGYSTGLYAQVPTQNPGGSVASVTLPYYYTVSNTANSTATKPFSQTSYASKTGFATLSSATAFYDFTLNSSGASFSAAQTVSGTLTVTAGGSINAGTNLTLKSSAAGTARVAAVSGSISGTVACEKYIAGGGLSTASPSTRAYRFMAHPFSTSLNMADITGTGEIDVTGSGGATNGFTATASNNPSAFKYDAASATSNAGAGLQAGWLAYTSANGGAGNTWDQYQGLRVFYRGAKGEGLTGAAYTVGSATISMAGTLNTGSKTINLNYNAGASTGFNLIGNPYPSNVDMTGVTNSNTTSSYYVWNLALGNRGGYTTVSFGNAYIMPQYASFFVEATAAGGNVTFAETNKTASSATNTLLRAVSNDRVRLQLKSGTILWDEMQMELGSQYKAAKEYADAAKLMNPEASLYSISSDNQLLAIDKRNLQDGDIVPLGLQTDAARSYTIEVSELGISNMELYLNDKYTHTLQKLEAGMVYSFATNADAASTGNGRFEILAKQMPALDVLTTAFSIKLSPNPSSDMVKVSFSNAEIAATTITLTNTEGKTIRTVNGGNVQSGQVDINVKGLAKGTYYITLNNGKERKTEKLQVQ